MANVNSPFGLKPSRYLNGAPWNGAVTRYYIPSTDGTACYIGDCVNLAGSADTAGVTPTVTRATAGSGNVITGVIVAFEPDPDNLTLLYRKASTNRYVYVCDDPNVIFEIQGSTDAALAATSVGLNAVLVDTHSGSTTTGLSGTEMYTGASTGTPAADATFQLLIMNAVDRPDNDMTLAHAKWEVIISLHRFRSIYDAHASAQYGLIGA